MTIYAAHAWPSNADLVAAIADDPLGYLRTEWLTLDATWGLGRFWSKWKPARLIAADGRPTKARDLCADFRALPFADGTFDAVVFDPPYKLNGTPSKGGPASSDHAYGVDEPATLAERSALILDGFAECARVTAPGGYLLAKCQDQVNGGHVRWQTHRLAVEGFAAGLDLVDELHVLGGREQPPGRRQAHARRNFSTLLVFRAASTTHRKEPML